MSRVLVIDDESDILAIVEAVLAVNGHEPWITTDPGLAVPLAIEHAVDAVVLDVNMPQRSGFETLDALRSHPGTANVPILFLSALGNSEHKIRGLRRGADDYLAKPFVGDELLLRIERLCQRTRRVAALNGGRQELLEHALHTGDFESKQIYFGRYQAQEVIGRGGMGVILRAWDPTLQRPVALKTVGLDKLGVGPDSGIEFVSQLIREGAALAQFNHPNIVAVYDAGVDGDVGFMVMELVEGVSLLDLAHTRDIEPDQVIHLGIAISRALATAHQHGITHRDVKPGNVLLGYGGAIKVSDFGLAQTVESLAQNGRLFGTPGFLPPECLLGERHEPPGDIFGLGAVLYLCATGRSVFTGQTLRDLLASNLAAQPVAPDKIRPQLPAALSGLIVDLLTADPTARPTAVEVEQCLSRMVSIESSWEPAVLRECKPATGSASSRAAYSADLIDTRQ